MPPVKKARTTDALPRKVQMRAERQNRRKLRIAGGSLQTARGKKFDQLTQQEKDDLLKLVLLKLDLIEPD
jgi:hypothetical protein